jgi:D-serine dehydratase
MPWEWSEDDDEALRHLSGHRPTGWINAARDAFVAPDQRVAIKNASSRMSRFAPVLAGIFPELRRARGEIRSPLLAGAEMAAPIGFESDPGSFWIKADHLLPVGGSIKARGGAHAVLDIAERVLGLAGAKSSIHLSKSGLTDKARKTFASHTVSVGSTGNLGMSVGTFASAFGFRATVHMSSQSREWKKSRLRSHGVTVVEHEGDYLDALSSAREAARHDATNHFIDDESSESLLYGYAAAAVELQTQLLQAGRVVDAAHPLFVYLPCGVGGAPTGIALGLNALFGAHVHCFYAEPVEAPCVLLAMAGGDASCSVYDLGLSGVTEADGLAVPRASGLAAELSRHVAAGAHTVRDETLFEHLRVAYQRMQLRLEPSAAAGFDGAVRLSGAAGLAYAARATPTVRIEHATHVVWTTGGMLVPDEEFNGFLSRSQPRP